MLNLYGARESIDKERFIYEQVKGSSRESLILVPNQYTLVAEEQALKYLETSCLFDTEILSMNRLGHRVLSEKGMESVQMLSRYGRFMLLSKIIRDHKDELNLFRNAAGKVGFTAMLDDFISSFKQQNCSIEDIERMLEDDESNVILKDKLKELKGIVADYEASIAGKYTDSEDYIAMYVDAIPESKYVEGKDIWIYGYDSITPKFLQAMLALDKKANQVNFIVNRSDYGLDKLVVSTIKAGAYEAGVDVLEFEIGEEFELDRSESIARIERGLFAQITPKDLVESNKDFVPSDIELVQCANQYYEAENAAAYIHHLIRDEGYELRDITVICNREDELQPIVKRALVEYGIPVFLDATRNITDSIGVVFIINLLKCIAFDYSSDSIFALLKTGLTDVTTEQIEDLENYTRTYGIRNTMWTRDFKYGAHVIGDEELARLNALRASIVEPIMALRKVADSGCTTGEFVDFFGKLLENSYDLRNRNEEAAIKQEDGGYNEDAQRTRLSLEEAFKLLEQLREIMGDCVLDRREILDVYANGLLAVEIGMIPPSLDGLSMGTLIRTRPRPSKAVIVIGANEGMLPLQPSTEGLFSVDEKAYFKQMNFPLGSLDDIKMIEENVAMYRMLSHPSERLYISYSMTNENGDAITQSSIVDALTSFMPKLPMKKDIVSEGWGLNLVNDREETLRHLTNHIKDRTMPKEGDILTKVLLSWYRRNNPDMLDVMLEAAQDENYQPKLGTEISGGLYARSNGDYVLSASKVNKYNGCPFGYYVLYGLKPHEERSYQSDSRSIGNLYHECLQDAAEDIMARRKNGEPPFSDDELRDKIDARLSAIAQRYDGGLFLSTNAEKFHLDRIREICFGAVKALAVQLANDKLEEVFLEEDFKYGHIFKPVEIEVEGQKVYIEGRIDRADVLEGDNIRIVDYKTGKDTVNLSKMAQGYKMQLMIYLLAATQDHYKPAGIYYFNIKDPELAMNDKSEKQEAELLEQGVEENFKLAGKYVDVGNMGDMMPKSILQGRALGMASEEFEYLRKSVKERLNEIGNSLVDGAIEVSPLSRDNNTLECNYCSYKAICRYDNNNAGNKSRKLK